MTIQEVAKKVMKNKGIRQVDIAERNDTRQSSVATWLQSNSMRVDNFMKILDTCGYDLVVMDRDGKHPSYRVGLDSGEDVVDMFEGKKVDAPDYAEMIEKAVSEALRARGL